MRDEHASRLRSLSAARQRRADREAYGWLSPPRSFRASRSARGRRDGWARLGAELPGADSRRHVLRFRAVDAPVLELDHGIDTLAAQALKIIAFAAPYRAFDELVVDALLVERPLHSPAGVWLDLEPHVAAAVKLDGHGVPSLGEILGDRVANCPAGPSLSSGSDATATILFTSL